MTTDEYTANYTEISPNSSLPNDTQRLHALIAEMAQALEASRERHDYASKKFLEIRQLIDSEVSRKHNRLGTHRMPNSSPRNIVSVKQSLLNDNDKTPSYPPQNAVSPNTLNSRPQTNFDIFQKFCEDYNKGASLQQKQEFRRHYKPIRIGVINAMARLEDARIISVFQVASNGDLFAIKVKGNSFFAVVPRFDLTFTRAHFELGVFDCPGYNPQHRYRHMKVIRPALFEADFAKQRWTLCKKGELDLGQGE